MISESSTLSYSISDVKCLISRDWIQSKSFTYINYKKCTTDGNHQNSKDSVTHSWVSWKSSATNPSCKVQRKFSLYNTTSVTRLSINTVPAIRVQNHKNFTNRITNFNVLVWVVYLWWLMVGVLYGGTRKSPYSLNEIRNNCIHFGGLGHYELIVRFSSEKFSRKGRTDCLYFIFIFKIISKYGLLRGGKYQRKRDK